VTAGATLVAQARVLRPVRLLPKSNHRPCPPAARPGPRDADPRGHRPRTVRLAGGPGREPAGLHPGALRGPRRVGWPTGQHRVTGFLPARRNGTSGAPGTITAASALAELPAWGGTFRPQRSVRSRPTPPTSCRTTAARSRSDPAALICIDWPEPTFLSGGNGGYVDFDGLRHRADPGPACRATARLLEQRPGTWDFGHPTPGVTTIPTSLPTCRPQALAAPRSAPRSGSDRPLRAGFLVRGEPGW